jgi:hypothetical protein
MAASTTKVGNLKGPKGDAGNNGTNGKSLTTGNGAPSAAVIAAASVGDSYIDQATGDLYTFS